MNIDVHMTTCHRSDVRCRPRGNDHHVEGFNVTEWTPEERLEMSKIALASLRQFVESLPDTHRVRISLLDDGSNYAPATEWLTELSENSNWLNVIRGEACGSAETINRYADTIPEDTDLVFHAEDDQIFFNPTKLDWADVCWQILDDPKATNKVITFRSGLPTQADDPGLRGAWGPVDTGPRLIYFNFMGNAHHVMRYQDYMQMLPLSGNTGSCEAQMNQTLLKKKWRNAELQEPVFVFHSHKLNDPGPKNPTTDDWNKTGRGIEFGLKDMHEHLIAKKVITGIWYARWPDAKISMDYRKDYYYAHYAADTAGVRRKTRKPSRRVAKLSEPEAPLD